MSQWSVAEFISEGHLTRHVKKMRALYHRRREALGLALARELGDELVPIPSRYGMHVAAIGNSSLPLEAATRALLRQNLRLHSLRRYYAGAETQQGLVFGLGAVAVAEIDRGVEMLARALESKKH